ncbi:MAG: aspartate aminotransferase family protein [Halolamina sp.]
MVDPGFVFSEKPLNIAGGEGMTLVGTDGTEYLDFGASYACTPLGHSPPAVVETIREQAGNLLYVQGSYPVDVRTALRERLAEVAPGEISHVWLCNSGTEATEAALKFARSATGREKVVAAKRAFHGRTLGALSLTWKDAYRDPFGPLPGAVEFVPYGDAEALATAVDTETAAVFLEPVQGEGGVHPAGEEYLQTAREVTAGADAALVMDEIQTGLGRTGTLWAAEAAGIVPDIVTAAKGIASGLPMGATLCKEWIAADAGNHGSTFAGNPLVAAAADATLAGIAEQDVAGNAAGVGSYLQSELAAAVERHSLPVRDVRGEGLMVGVEVKHGAMSVLRDLALEEQVLALPAGRSVVRLLPPLIADQAHADAFVESFVEVLA